MTSPQNWTGQTIGGRYRIETPLGQGGMSAVYKGADPNLRRTVAVKLIHSHLAQDPEFVRRFEEEAASVAQLRHPNIIQVYDFNHDGDTYFMVLEFVSGESLHEKLLNLRAHNKIMPLDQTVDIMAVVADAVHYAHQRGLIHRDLKPANVMINATGQPILMDFGIAKILGGQQHTVTGVVIGTPAYMAPEQARGEHPDHRVDIYALGAMLFEMVTGRVPFDSTEPLGVLLKHVTDPVPDIRTINPNVPEALVAVIEKALAKKPDDRFQSARDLAAALRHISLAPTDHTNIVALTENLRTASDTRQLDAPSTRAEKIKTPEQSSTLFVREPSPANRWLPMALGVGAIGVIGIVIVGIVVAIIGFQKFGPTPTPVADTSTQTAVALSLTEQLPETESPVATATAEPAPPTDTAPPPTPEPSPTSTLPPPPDGMALVPAGFFNMGSSTGRADERPEHPVLLDAFYMDITEVTNAMYRECVEAGVCTASGSGRMNNPAFGNYPVTVVSWKQSAEYCGWAGKRLPTEAEWEYAASGPENLTWPWGNTFDPSLSAATAPDLQPVGSFPGGASPFGLHDMAGNATEWVQDFYSTDFYANSPTTNPVNESGANRVYRGGSYGLTAADGAFFTTSRRFERSVVSDVDIGFRCAKDAPEVNAARTQEEFDALIKSFCAAYRVYKPEAACP
jgi:serine/threonine-protein kinase